MKTVTGTFQDSLGNPLIGAKVWFRLSQDAIASGTAVVAPAIVSGTTNGTGVLSVSLYFNDELSPANTTYAVAVVQAGGGLVWGAENIFINGASFNLNTAVPTSQGVIFANPVVTNPSAQQTINGFPLVMEGAPLGFSAAGSAVSDLGLSRDSAGVLDVGNGTQGDTSATIKAAKFQGTDATAFSIGSITSVQRVVYSGGNAGFEYEFLTSANAIAGVQIASLDAFETASAVGGAAGHAGLWANSLTHFWAAKNNNGTPYNLVGDTTTQLLTNKSIGAGGLGGLTTGKQLFSATGTFTIPAGVTSVKVTVLGGGGGGGGSTATVIGGGGASGSWAIKWLTGLTPGLTIAVTINGGGGGGVNNAAGTAGGSVNIASGTQTITTITAPGGGGGASGTSLQAGGVPGAVATNGDINVGGNPGMWATAATTFPGNGGTSPYGSGGSGNNGTVGSSLPGTGFGSGGSGANSGANGTGGAGTNGMVLFEWVD